MRPITLTSPFEENVARLRSDYPFFCESVLKINPKIKELVSSREEGIESSRGPLISFVWNKAQKRVWAIMYEKLRAGKPVKLVVLKARQVGMSTFFCAYIFWQMWRQSHYRAGVVAYEKRTTLAELNETMNTFRDAMPDEHKPSLRQFIKSGRGRITKEEVYFADRKSKATFAVQKANALRGLPFEAVLCTEVSFYKEADEFFGGFIPAMSEGPNALLVMESSPADGWFRDEYEAARDGETDRTAIFIPWWMCDDIYTREVKQVGRKYIDVLTGEEADFPPELRAKKRHLTRLALKQNLPPITDSQMWWWWRYCLGNYKGDESWMQQEFPDDDVSAFQRASRSAFKVCLPIMTHTVAQAAEVFPESSMGLLQSSTYLSCESLEQIIQFEPEPKVGYYDQEKRPGFLMMEPPKPGLTYVIGADVADAEGEEDEEGERAFSVGCVYCCNSREQVAEWRGHIDPTDWGDELVKMGYLYNTALLVVERNNMGRLTEHRIKVQLRYPRRFRWPDWNVGPEQLTKKEMWETTGTTKPIMIGALRQWVRDGLFIVRSAGLLDEMAHYRVTRGKFENQDRAADRIIAAALCVQGVEQTEFAYKNIVLGGNAVKESLSASGMAKRIVTQKRVPPAPRGALPEEFGEERLRMRDVFVDAGFDERSPFRGLPV